MNVNFTEAGRIMAAFIEVARAEAWQEGWHAHFLELDKQRLDPTHPITQTNPYNDKGVKS